MVTRRVSEDLLATAEVLAYASGYQQLASLRR